MTWIVVPNWDKFQHYSDRNPPWIKLYTELESSDEWRQLTLAERGLLVSIWLEYARSSTQLRTSDVPSRVAQKTRRRSLESLRKAGFIDFSDSAPLASRARARRDRDRPPKSPNHKPKTKTTGWRLVRGTHGVSHVPDPQGTDRPPPEVRT